MKKVFLWALSLFIIFGLALAVSAVSAKSGANLVDVTSCEQVGKDIKISRNNGNKYTLTSAIRDAGHGLRNYKLNCVSGTKYKVEWADVATSTIGSVVPTSPANPPVSIVIDTQAPEIILSGRRFGNHLDLKVYAVDAKIKSPVTKIEVYQQSTATQIFSWENSGATAKDVLKHFQTSDFSSSGTYSFFAKAYDKFGNVGTSVTLVLPPDTNHLRVANSSLTWIYDNILLKVGNIKENGLKQFSVYAGNGMNKNNMTLVASCSTILADVNNFPCVYFNPAKLKPTGFAYITAKDNKNIVTILPVMPYSW